MTDTDLARYYVEVKDLGHVWIFGVCGRSSTTALQRLLNSSNQVCILGEPWGAVNALLKSIGTLESLNTERRRTLTAKHYQRLLDAFAAHRHDRFYANAFPPIDETLLLLKGVLSNLLRPVNDARRFGVKGIAAADGIELVHALCSTFPASHVLILFRDPRPQWRSVRGTGWFPYSNSLQGFLDAYEHISNHYLRCASTLPLLHFIEAQDLYDPEKVRALMRRLDIQHIDESLIGLPVSSAQRTAPDDVADTRAIETSAAYRNYLRMRELAGSFFASLAKPAS